MKPHAHYRAREIGDRDPARRFDEAVIYIKDWDFRWQHVYRYVTPVPLPQGTTLTMRYTYRQFRVSPQSRASSAERGMGSSLLG